jgi:hypothetical protein
MVMAVVTDSVVYRDSATGPASQFVIYESIAVLILAEVHNSREIC